ncbi:hypothetical protein [Actinomadura keratinilytica]|jgi:hypothetical protein|uniref:CopG family transcriptional regulator n=1 Tax=Actinomadura keratinilytica TaxID=547461 RepID=A0ABP7YLV6_9ACTN
MAALPSEHDAPLALSASAQDRIHALERLLILYGSSQHDEAMFRLAAASGGDPRSLGPARKVSVSLPEGLTEAVRQRVGKGEFSRYVAAAVARQLESDLLAELAAELEAEHGPIPEEFLAEARDAWPDHD